MAETMIQNIWTGFETIFTIAMIQLCFIYFVAGVAASAKLIDEHLRKEGIIR